MRAIHKILHPTDFSKGAEPAMELAIELAQKLGAELTLLHVFAMPVYMGPFGDGLALQPEIVQRLEEDVERALSQLCQRVSAAGVPTRTIAMAGTASDAIIAVAANGMDLIVMGSHGRTGFKHLLLGSVAERVLRGSACPVLTVRVSTEHTPN